MNTRIRASAHPYRPLVHAGLIASLAIVLVAGTALAGKPSSGGTTTSSTIALTMVIDADGSRTPNWNDQVSFEVRTSATAKPWVKLNCYQGSTWVSTSTAGFFADYPWAPNFTLSSGGWTSGAADCTATLYMVTSNGRNRNLATLSFHVDG